ncbi:MAG: hypothetical protein KAX18_11175, partial [Candidatus Lokiarchaeota archaeon]|nr:hypothetical protein [Candidatus Lokiarchaeota archaeon]
FITPAKWFLFFVILKNKDIRKIAITLRLRFEYLNGKRNSHTASIFSLKIFIFSIFNIIDNTTDTPISKNRLYSRILKSGKFSKLEI